MASITVKNIPTDLHARLRQSADAHHRSINSEMIVCLEKALMPTHRNPEEQILAARNLRKKVDAEQLDIEEIDQARKTGRP